MTKRWIEPIPPGEHLKEEVESRGWTQQDLADVIGRPVQAVNEILNGKKSITPEMSLLLGQAIGTSSEYWLNLEQNYRLDLAVSKTTDDLVAEKSKLFLAAPIRELLKKEWLDVKCTKTKLTSHDVEMLKGSVARFFAVPNFEKIEGQLSCASFRRARDDSSITPSINAWLQKAKLTAREEKTSKNFNKDSLVAAAAKLRELTVQNEQGVISTKKMLLSYGIRLVFVPHLQKTKVDGAAFWISDKEPVICLSLRYARIDSVWFTLFHELAHLILHENGSKPHIDEQIELRAEEPQEREADEFAQKLLIPDDRFQLFKRRGDFSRNAILAFAKAEKIYPGIVVGRLQNDGKLLFSQQQQLLGKLNREAVWDA